MVGLAYSSLYEVDIQCDSKGLTALSGLMSRTAEGVHGKPVTFKIEKTKFHIFVKKHEFCQLDEPTNGFNKINLQFLVISLSIS